MIIPRKIAEMLFEHAIREAPIESCGYLAGTGERISKAYPMKNADGREDHFSFDPAEQFAVIKESRAEGLSIVGVYHSHPATPARPSAEDIKLAYDSDILYIIVSLANGSRAVRGYRISGGRVDEETLIVEEDEYEQ